MKPYASCIEFVDKNDDDSRDCEEEKNQQYEEKLVADSAQKA